MTYREPFAIGEWYHCYNRGVDKRIVFNREADYYRFLMLMRLANSASSSRVRDVCDHSKRPTLKAIFARPQSDELVEVGAYCLMPNHYHLLLREKAEGGISAYMRKIGTGYTLYFNLINDRSGSLFQGRFKSRHIHNDNYLKRVTNYIHANPLELLPKPHSKSLPMYKFSSLPDYLDVARTQSRLLGPALATYFERFPSIQEIIDEAAIFEKSEDTLLGPDK